MTVDTVDISDVPAFDLHMLQLATDFLETVVVVDDQLFDRVQDEDPAEGRIEGPRVVGRGVTPDLVPPSSPVPDVHALNSKVISDAFANAGLVCSLLCPDSDEDITDNLLKAASRADLIVLDWVIHRDNGNKTLALIKRILESDRAPQKRLRTIAIYTAQKDLVDVAKRLSSAIDQVYPGGELKESDGGLTITKGPLRAAVFAKENVADLPPDLECRRVMIKDLPQKLQSEFAALASGLISGVALSALGALRRDTHRVLSILRPQIDGAFLGHRAALHTPNDASELATVMVAAELRSILDDNNVASGLYIEIIEHWLGQLLNAGHKFVTNVGSEKEYSPEVVRSILKYGLGSDEGLVEIQKVDGSLSKSELNKLKRNPGRLFYATQAEAESAVSEFASRIMLRTFYGGPERLLRLGTIIRTRASGQYLLCVQPVCDSVRLDGKRAFPFLPLEVVTSKGAAIAVKDSTTGDWFHLALAGDPYSLTMIDFSPLESHRVVRAEMRERNCYSYKDVSTRIHIWIGELKQEFSQQIAGELGHQFARVGVNESEFMRLSRQG